MIPISEMNAMAEKIGKIWEREYREYSKYQLGSPIKYKPLGEWKKEMKKGEGMKRKVPLIQEPVEKLYFPMEKVKKLLKLRHNETPVGQYNFWHEICKIYPKVRDCLYKAYFMADIGWVEKVKE